MEWISVEDKLPEREDGEFLAYWKISNRILVCFVDLDDYYITAGTKGNAVGWENNPHFSHWMLLPEPPAK